MWPMAAGDAARLYHRLSSFTYVPEDPWSNPHLPPPIDHPLVPPGVRPVRARAPPTRHQALSLGPTKHRATARLDRASPGRDGGARRDVDDRYAGGAPRPRPAPPPVRWCGPVPRPQAVTRRRLAIPGGRLGGRPVPTGGLRGRTRRGGPRGRRLLVRPCCARARPHRAAAARRRPRDDCGRDRRRLADSVALHRARLPPRLLGRRVDARSTPRARPLGGVAAAPLHSLPDVRLAALVG